MFGTWVCFSLAANQPLLIAIDDAHLADAPSMRFVSFLAARLDGLSAAMLLALRPGERQRGDGLLESVRNDPATKLLRPSELSEPACREFIGELFEAPPSRPSAGPASRQRGQPVLSARARRWPARQRDQADGRQRRAGCGAGAGHGGPGAEVVDWDEVAVLYERLERLTGSPVVALNRAVAIAEGGAPERALELVDSLELGDYRYLHSTRAEL